MYRKIMIFILGLAGIFTLGNLVEATEVTISHLGLLENRLIEDEEIDSRRFKEFMDLDKEYLKREGLSREEIKKQIDYLEELIYENNQYFITTARKTIIYPPNTVGNINVYSVARDNRKKILDRGSKEGFVYRESIFYYPQKAILADYKSHIRGDRLLENYRQTKSLLEKIDLPDRYLEGLIVSISPYSLEGIEGFTEMVDSSKKKVTLVVAKDIKNTSTRSNIYKKTIQSTVLHELGHVFHYKSTSYQGNGRVINIEDEFWKDYNSLYENKLTRVYNPDTTLGWDQDILENFAEDFRVSYSKKLGKDSFNGRNKRTIYKYNKNFERFMENKMII